jgi:hypothetical protein
MSLLGTPLLITVAVLAALLPAVTIAAWSRLRGRRGARAAQRMALVVACQLAAVALVGVSLNDYGDFYSSWASLLHTGPLTASIGGLRSGTGAARSAGSITVLPDAAGTPRSRWPTRGRLESVELVGASSALEEHAFVYLPPQYFQPAYAHVRFPALEVLSGYPGREADLTGGMDYPNVLLGLIRMHRAVPTVLVLLLPSVTYPRDTECTDVPGGPQAAGFYFADLPGQISAAYRVLPHGWGAIGGSTGGYCAVKFAMLHPDVCSAAVSIQGYFYALRDDTTGDLWAGSPAVRDLNDLEWRLQHEPAPPISVLLVSSFDQTGPDGYRDTQRFASLVHAPMSARTVIYPHGGHNIATWRVGLSGELAWLIGRLPPPGP